MGQAPVAPVAGHLTVAPWPGPHLARCGVHRVGSGGLVPARGWVRSRHRGTRHLRSPVVLLLVGRGAVPGVLAVIVLLAVAGAVAGLSVEGVGRGGGGEPWAGAGVAVLLLLGVAVGGLLAGGGWPRLEGGGALLHSLLLLGPRTLS